MSNREFNGLRIVKKKGYIKIEQEELKEDKSLSKSNKGRPAIIYCKKVKEIAGKIKEDLATLGFLINEKDVSFVKKDISFVNKEIEEGVKPSSIICIKRDDKNYVSGTIKKILETLKSEKESKEKAKLKFATLPTPEKGIAEEDEHLKIVVETTIILPVNSNTDIAPVHKIKSSVVSDDISYLFIINSVYGYLTQSYDIQNEKKVIKIKGDYSKILDFVINNQDFTGKTLSKEFIPEQHKNEILFSLNSLPELSIMLNTLKHDKQIQIKDEDLEFLLNFSFAETLKQEKKAIKEKIAEYKNLAIEIKNRKKLLKTIS